MTSRKRLLILNAALGPLDYTIPAHLHVEAGSVVTAPLGPRRVTGIVWDEGRLEGDEVPVEKLRPIFEVVPVAPLAEPLRRLIEWTAHYYCAPLASVARMVLASGGALGGPTTRAEYRLAKQGGDGEPKVRLTAQRKRAIEALAGDQGTLRELAEAAQVSTSVLRSMVNAGLLEPVSVAIDKPFKAPIADFHQPDLSPEQRAIADQLSAAVKARAFTPFLLDGVTGSGKTETYFEPIAEAIRMGRQVLVLLPEIALTENFLARFASRFGVAPVLWHSSLKSTQRRRAFRAIDKGEAKVVVGARSALFLPFDDLGLIVVDEAHEVSFKQDDGVRYNARDVSVMRARFESIPVILASATPALESLHMANTGTYQRLELPRRFGGASLPAIRLIDLTVEKPGQGQWLSTPLIEGIKERLARGEQSLLFLNRRGYAPLTLCRNCGHRFKCPYCSAWLVEHRLSSRLSCHHCGHETRVPDACPECGEPDCLVACGPGVERIADEVAALFPEARVAVATSDTLGNPQRAAEFIAMAEQKAIDVIVGTQLVTKGFHFPDLTLVGVVDADLGLEGGDLRAAERTYQQVAQVAGRAGRGGKPGEVLIQTRHTDAPVIAALEAGDRDAFYEAETEARRDAGAPPFGRWAAIIISSEDERAAREAAQRLGDARPQHPDIAVLGPAPAPLALLRARYRYRFLVNARRSANLQDTLRQWTAKVQFTGDVRVGIDIDPYSFV